MAEPVVSIVIPHWLGDVLSTCLETVYERTRGVEFEVIVANDQPYDDGSLGRARERFPEIRIVKVGGGRGMGAGCNRGMEVAEGRYAMLLNNDVEVAEGWLPPLLDAAEGDRRIGVCQPKVLSLRDRTRFDYGGAAGGMIDTLGYTFCLGRMFEHVEQDHGQYDAHRDIFWAVGGAMLVRMSCLERTGLMDEAFYMHNEEIDLCWRMHLAGYRIVSVPRSTVYHYGGWSLEAESYKKAYCNHRNQLVMVLKNLSAERLIWAFPARAVFEMATVALGVLRGDWKHPVAALAGLLWVLTHPLEVLRRRREAQRSRAVPDAVISRQMYRGSIVYAYFIRGIRTASSLLRATRRGELPR
ncbi:MAG: glycosyltransferase family 2 protein [Candidatus Latescibacteria bacterium]|jgi:hypothetical protein|nr:glycosyltransferase family 2 protein [Candidatus Latescibacterota bacterium]